MSPPVQMRHNKKTTLSLYLQLFQRFYEALNWTVVTLSIKINSSSMETIKGRVGGNVSGYYALVRFLVPIGSEIFILQLKSHSGDLLTFLKETNYSCTLHG